MSWTEKAGIPAVGIICQGFVGSSSLVAEKEGLANARIIEYPPPNIAVQNPQEVYEHAKKVVSKVIKGLTEPVTAARRVVIKPVEVDPREIVFAGTLEEVNEFFRRTRRTDGLPVIPPTLEAVEEMLRYTDRSPKEVLGVLPPANGEATVWNVAVNGVMAGCRPEYMPVLLALIEAIAEPRFGLEEAMSSSGWTPLIILNGPIIKELNFNYGIGVMRPERQANITVARCLRLCMVNIAGFIVGVTEICTFGRNYHPVLAEAEDENPWEPLSVDRGFKRGSNVITVLSSMGIGDHFLTYGGASDQLDDLAKEVSWGLTFNTHPVAILEPETSPVVCLSPVIASTIASGGYSKSDVKRYLYENARLPAYRFEEKIRPTLQEAVKSGRLPEVFAESDDPNRLLPLVHGPEQFLIVVSGHVNRNRSFVSAQVGRQGMAVSKEIKLPKNWDKLLKPTK